MKQRLFTNPTDGMGSKNLEKNLNIQFLSFPFLLPSHVIFIYDFHQIKTHMLQ